MTRFHALCLAFLVSPVLGNDAPLPKDRARLWNISTEPFTYQLATISGTGWSAPVTLAPGKYQEIRLPKRGEVSEWAGLADFIPHLTIQSRQPIGLCRVRLPGKNESGEIVRQWFFVKDSNG